MMNDPDEELVSMEVCCDENPMTNVYDPFHVKPNVEYRKQVLSCVQLNMRSFFSDKKLKASSVSPYLCAINNSFDLILAQKERKFLKSFIKH